MAPSCWSTTSARSTSFGAGNRHPRRGRTSSRCSCRWCAASCGRSCRRAPTSSPAPTSRPTPTPTTRSPASTPTRSPPSPPATGVSERVIRDWFEHSLITDQSFRAQSFEFPHEHGAEVLKALEDAYLIRADSRRGVNWYELTHDRMIAPVIENNAEWRESRLNPLQMRASEWEANGRPAGLLVTGEVLGDAETWASTSPDSTPVERDFVAASRVAENDAKAELARHEDGDPQGPPALPAVRRARACSPWPASSSPRSSSSAPTTAQARAPSGKRATAHIRGAAQAALKSLKETQRRRGGRDARRAVTRQQRPVRGRAARHRGRVATDESGPEPRHAWAAAVGRLGRQPDVELGGAVPLERGTPCQMSMAWSPDDKVLAIGNRRWRAAVVRWHHPRQIGIKSSQRPAPTRPATQVDDLRWTTNGCDGDDSRAVTCASTTRRPTKLIADVGTSSTSP